MVMEVGLRLIICLLWLTHETSVAAPSMAKPDCNDRCGNITIPYPFGIGKNCYASSWFSINCDHSFKPPKPFLNNTRLNLEVLNITAGDSGTSRKWVVVNRPVASFCRNGGPEVKTSRTTSVDLNESPFYYSDWNSFMVVGCDNVNAILKDRHGETVAGCHSICNNNTNIGGRCYGINCCLTTVTDYLNFYTTDIINGSSGSGSGSGVECTYAFLVHDTSSSNFSDITNGVKVARYAPLSMSWITPQSVDRHRCYNDSFYASWGNYSDYYCYCKRTEEGNPYLFHGCQVVEACAKCKGKCRYNSERGSYCSKQLSTEQKILILGFSIGGGLLFLILGSVWLFKEVKKRKEVKLKQKFFKQNGGLLLQQQISCDEGTVDKIMIFTSNELEKATDNFNQNRILGQGGQGTVYKGMLTDGQIVAIKRSIIIDESQVGQFINEIVILSQINHRNIVRLLGCCLETEVPLLVYEFIPNGNLFQLVHGEDSEFPLSWKMRLQIATEVAGALAYLHSSSSMPIYHRDIKSTNILLDDKYRAKVSDFGTSRTISIEKTHLTTLVYGTFGYLDPEYFQSSQFTEKSDVYSFGVVLVELITGQTPISSLRSEEEKSLATRFILSLEETRLFDMLDVQVIKEGSQEEIMAIANIAYRCLNLNGKKRPTMKEVTMELEHIRMSPSSMNIQEKLEEDEYVGAEMTGLLDDYTTSTRPCLDCNTASSVDVQPLLFNTIPCSKT